MDVKAQMPEGERPHPYDKPKNPEYSDVRFANKCH